MIYQELVKDFARRTRVNLDIIEKLHETECASESYDEHNPTVYEVTQLINSMLGLLIFPREEYLEHFRSMPTTSLEDLKKQGWPIPRVVGNYKQVSNLYQLIRYLRNAIAHFNLEFTNERGEIVGIKVWNTEMTGKITWKAELRVEELKLITNRFIELLLRD